jgi:uncharacterized membrane protein YbhN (UPF0104 family)
MARPGRQITREAIMTAARRVMAVALGGMAVLAAVQHRSELAVPWRGILVIYGLTQIAASLPVTPGGLGVVEGSMAALLIAYGVHAPEAFATVLLYRIISFWGLVPVGWGAFLGLELAERRAYRPSTPAVVIPVPFPAQAGSGSRSSKAA